MKEPKWLQKDAVIALQRKLLVWHGGAEGIRDHGLLESALARPQQLFAYEKPTIFSMAAAYLFGLAKNHAFVDGNKRIAFTAAAVFLEINGYVLEASEADAVFTVLAVAAGDMNEKQLAGWLKKNCARG